MRVSARAARWRLQAELFVWRQGWLAAAALLLATLLLAHEAWAWRRSVLDWQALQASAAAAGAAQAHSPQASPAPRRDVGEQLPPAVPPVQAVEPLLQVSRQAGLAWPRASYRADEANTEGPVRWRVTQTTPSDYPTLRQTVLGTLGALPQVSLDRLSARRDAAGRDSLDSTLEWSVWMRPPGPSMALPPTQPGWDLLERALPGADAAPRDLFTALAPPPPPARPEAPPAPAEAPAPEAPEPPPDIRVLGKQWDGERWLVFVSEGTHTSVLREGDALQDGHRVERIAPPTLLLRRDGAAATQSVPIGEAP